MRKIYFRGKSVKNGGWLYGDYLNNRGKDFIAPRGIADPLASWEDFEVFPESVGQFTGLFDKNWKAIYEGDIIESGNRRYECVFTNGSFDFKDESDRIMANPLAVVSRVVGNVFDEKGGKE